MHKHVLINVINYYRNSDLDSSPTLGSRPFVLNLSLPGDLDCLLPNLSIYLWLFSPLLDLGRFFSFLILYTVGRTPWTGDQPVAKPLSTHRTSHRINGHSHPRLEWDSNPRSQHSSERRQSILRPRDHCDRRLLPNTGLYQELFTNKKRRQMSPLLQYRLVGFHRQLLMNFYQVLNFLS
jgi:hypothetical protein